MTFGKVLSLSLLLLLVSNPMVGQTYSLDKLIKFARKNSPTAMRMKTSKENKYWQWKTYKAEYLPQLVLDATLPAYQNNSIPVMQEDGSVVYQSVNQSQAFTALSLEQNIGLTGGKLFISTDLSRFDDFKLDTKSYSGSPFYIGFEQPLFAYNRLKWLNRIEPVKYTESLKKYVEGIEEISYTTTTKYFDLLISQVNYKIAITNKANADTIYKIGKEKYELGKISKNELLQLKFGLISAQKSMSTAGLLIKTSLAKLKAYTGVNEKNELTLELPDSIFRFQINDSLAVEKALENSRNSTQFKREILEARRDSEKARKESRLNASLFVSYGKTNIANEIPGIYENPQDMKTLNVGLRIPILDWGKSKAKRKTAAANLKLVEYTVQQNEINFKQEVVTEVENIKMLQEFIEYTTQADETATERYEIAKLRYIANNISITEYNIALEEKVRAKQDYIIALRNYWQTYYLIRMLTLYDFYNNTSLIDTDYAQKLY